MNVREIIEAYFTFLNSGEWDKWADLFDNNAIVDDMSNISKGKEAIRKSVDTIQQALPKFKNHLREIVVDGNKAMVVCEIEATTRKGTSLISKGANYYEIKGGKITYMASFHDSAHFTKAFQ
ncbi:MAG: nuclear transport factor 2 family protein [bacterium]